MISPNDFTGKKFLSRIPDADEPTRVRIAGRSNRSDNVSTRILGIMVMLFLLPFYFGWKDGGLDGAWRRFVELWTLMFPFQLAIIIPLMFWYYNRNSGAYFFRSSIVKGSRLTKTWMLSWKSSLYSEVSRVSYDSNWRKVELLGSDSTPLMAFKWLSESEEAELWPLIQSKIGIDKLDKSTSQRLAGIQSNEVRQRGWKQNAVIAISIIAIIVYVLWRLKYLG